MAKLLPVCGENPLGPAAAVGCGRTIEREGDVYRCTDCSVPFHRDCALAHFATARVAPVTVDWRRSCIRAEERGERLLALARRLRQALGGREADSTCSCMRCAALRAFDRFIADDNDNRRGAARCNTSDGSGLAATSTAETSPPVEVCRG